jgi:transcription-repair coupling factor (superfamily II helicase)
MRIAAIKRDATALGIEKIDASDAGGYLDFGSQTTTNPETLLQMVQNEPQTYRLRSAHRLQFRMDLVEAANRFTQVEKILDRLAVSAVISKAAG